ncbi:MAG TPA: cupin domain-containing protein [Acidobacteriota bacterium]
MKKCAFLIILSALTVCFVYAPPPAATHVVVRADQIKWGSAPPTLPAGAQMTVLSGDPSKPGLFTIRLKAPDGFKVAPHWHPTAENLTVLQGRFGIGTGDKFDPRPENELTTGSFTMMPAKMHHFAWTRGETVVQVSAMGPFKLIYVNPADNPNKPPVKPAKAATEKPKPKAKTGY